MKRSGCEKVKYSIDFDITIEHKKQLALLVEDLGVATVGAISPIPNNDFKVNVFEAGFLGDKYNECNVGILEKTINQSFQQHNINSFDVVPLEIGMMVNPHTETLSLGVDFDGSFRTIKLHILSAMQKALKELGCPSVGSLRKRDLRELTTRDDTKPRVDLAYYRPNILGLDPVKKIIDDCYNKSGITDDILTPRNPLSVAPDVLAIRGISLTRRSLEFSFGTPPGHAENIEGDYDYTGRILKNYEWAD